MLRWLLLAIVRTVSRPWTMKAPWTRSTTSKTGRSGMAAARAANTNRSVGANMGSLGASAPSANIGATTGDAGAPIVGLMNLTAGSARSKSNEVHRSLDGWHQLRSCRHAQCAYRCPASSSYEAHLRGLPPLPSLSELLLPPHTHVLFCKRGRDSLGPSWEPLLPLRSNLEPRALGVTNRGVKPPRPARLHLPLTPCGKPASPLSLHLLSPLHLMNPVVVREMRGRWPLFPRAARRCYRLRCQHRGTPSAHAFFRLPFALHATTTTRCSTTHSRTIATLTSLARKLHML